MGCIPPNYFIWIAQIKRKDLAREICFKTKEIGDLLYTGFGERMDPEVSHFLRLWFDGNTRRSSASSDEHAYFVS